MKKIYFKVLLLFIAISLLITPATAQNSRYIDNLTNFYPTDFVFEYNADGNSSTYNGDLGLTQAYCKNKADNKTYTMDVAMVRGIAYATKGTFIFDDNLTAGYEIWKDKHLNPTSLPEIYYLKYQNGTPIKSLDISDDLTLEQRKYFQDYESQKEQYYYDKEAKDRYAAQVNEEIDRSMMIKSMNKPKTTRGYYTGSGGGGSIHTTTY